jgi:hypothetical protein
MGTPATVTIAGWVWNYEDEDGIHYNSADPAFGGDCFAIFKTEDGAKAAVEAKLDEDGDVALWAHDRSERSWTCGYYRVYPIFWRD